MTPFSFKLKRQFKQPKKVYGIDTGLINALVPKIVLNYGRLMENLVFLELRRKDKEVYFYSQPNYEVDFLIKEGFEIKQLIQVCYSLKDEKTKKRELNALLKASKGLKCDHLLIITWDEEGEEKVNSHKVKFCPLWKWLLR
ncbi:MAG: DUF4143 domain-containing protein [Candidatus Desulfofervidaceae bacterium]|nr:DUF4143 domain-containing protein [Candidatus Desulfofervidaceae bacterium]